jgi:hypothetical protein
VEPEKTNWFGGSEVIRSPVQPELGAGNARATKLPLPATAKLALVSSGGEVRAPWQEAGTDDLCSQAETQLELCPPLICYSPLFFLWTLTPAQITPPPPITSKVLFSSSLCPFGCGCREARVED